MSYQNGTTHYNLPQTVGTDKRDWFDTNEAFADLDSAVYGAAQTGAVNSQKIEEAEGTIGQLNTRVGAVEEDVTDIKVNIATAQEDIGTLGTTLSGLTTEVRDNKTDLEDMITAYEEETATASMSHNVGDYFRYNNVLYITTITIRVGDTIVPDVNCRSTNVMTRVRALENQGGGQSPLASSVLYDNATSGLQATDVQNAIDELDSSLDIALQGVQSNGTNIGDLTTLLTTVKSNLVGAINELYGMIGGAGMKVYHGKATLPSSQNASVSVNISSLGLSSADDYYVILDMDGTAHDSGSGSYWGFGKCYIDDCTATSFKIKRTYGVTADTPVSYQVVYNAS